MDTVFMYLVRVLFKIPYVRHQAELNFRRPTDGFFGSMVRGIMNLKNRLGSERAAEELDVRPGDVFLEIGFGSGWAIRKVLPRNPSRVIGYEISESMFTEVSSATDLQDARIELHLSDCLKMAAVGAGTIDKMLIANVVYFLNPLEEYADEFHRVLSNDGKLVCLLKLKTVSRFDPEIFVNTEEGRITAVFENAGFVTEIQELNSSVERLPNNFSILSCTKK